MSCRRSCGQFPDSSSTSSYFRTTKDESTETSNSARSSSSDMGSPRRALQTSDSEIRVNIVTRSSSTHSAFDEARIDNVSALAESLIIDDSSQLPDFHKYFLGLKTAEEAAACTTPTSMRLYYQMPCDGSVPPELPLFLVYQSSKHSIFHFPIVEEAGRWRIKYGESAQVAYPSVRSLLQHHINYAIVSPLDADELESFEVWRTYTRC